MKPNLWFNLPFDAILLLSLASGSVAHGSHKVMNMSLSHADSMNAKPETYFQTVDWNGWMIAHISVMTLSWVFILPVAVMLSISRSHYSRPMQFAFLLSNGIGIGLAIVYNINTPDLYPNNSHHKLGWFVTWLCVAQVTLSLILKYPKRNISYAFTPVSQEAMAEHQRNPMSREECQCFSHVDSGHGTETSTSIQSRSSASFSSEDVQLLSPQQLSEETEEEKQVSMKRKRWGWTTRFTFRMLSHRFPQLLGHMYDAVDRLILLLGFVAISTGWITYGGLFKGAALFSGLAHFIKGGVFFWFGILTLGRWAGCFAEIGWAWNIKSARNNHPTAEFVESFLLFFYGFTNVFMEHLAAWGAAWSAQDLEHISLTVMFFGGGLCGMLIESATLRAILNERNTSPKSEIYRTIMASHETDEPPSYQISINPLPALIIILLGKMMSSHQQETMVSTMLHSLWGSLLMAAAFARLATYLLLYLSPPRSIFPGRPPTELLAAFCFMAGGLLFMCSARDMVETIEMYHLDAMFVFSVAVGVVTILMAWIIVVIAIKGWAVRKRNGLLGLRFVA